MEPNRVPEGQQLTVDGRGNLQYASGASSGHIEVELPSLPGSPNATERLLARDFGPHVAGRIEASMSKQGYLKSGPQQSGPEVLGHFTAVAKGSKLVHSEAINQMERLAKEFRTQPVKDRETYYRTMIQPFLNSLAPQRRQK
jgi:hypothetical protein